MSVAYDVRPPAVRASDQSKIAKASDVRVAVEGQRLRVLVVAKIEEGETVEALLPQREISVILPRSILLKEEASPEILSEIEGLIRRFVVGRTIRLRQFENSTYCFFLTWRSVRFAERGSNGA